MKDWSGRQRSVFFWSVIAMAVVVGAALAWAVTTWLLDEATRARDPAASRIDAIKTGLTIGAGTIGAFALLLAVRRQWHQEVTAADTKVDAAERRITELTYCARTYGCRIRLRTADRPMTSVSPERNCRFALPRNVF